MIFEQQIGRGVFARFYGISKMPKEWNGEGKLHRANRDG